MPPKEVEVVVCIVVGGEADRDKEARERAAVFDAGLLRNGRSSRNKESVCVNVQRTSTSFTSIAESSSRLSCRPQTTMVFTS